MSKSSLTLTTADPGPKKIAFPNGIRKTYWLGTIFTTGAFGGGTVAYTISPDNGVTSIPLKNTAGTSYTATTNDYQSTGALGGSNNSTGDLSIWATLTGSAGGSVNVTVFDNV